MNSFRVNSSAFTAAAATGGARLVQASDAIVNKVYAQNGSAYASADRIAHYLAKAKGGAAPRDFRAHGANATDYLDIPNGGIRIPQDSAVWQGQIFRVAYVENPRAREADVVNTALSGAWWMTRETFMYVLAKVASPAELLEQLRAVFALGFTLHAATTRIVSAPVAGPTAIYKGQGNPASDGYDATTFPIRHGDPTINQIFIPGIRDTGDRPDRAVIHSVFKVDATNSWDAAGVMARFHSVTMAP